VQPSADQALGPARRAADPTGSLPGLLRGSAVYFFGSLLALALGYVYHFAAGRLLGPRDYAPVAAVSSLFFVLLVPGQLVLTATMKWTAALLATGSAGRLHALIVHVRRLAVLATLLGTLLFLVSSPIIATFLAIPVATVIALTPAVALVLVTSMNRGVIQGEQRFLTLSALLVLDAAVRVACALILISAGLGTGGAVVALGLGMVVSYGVSVIKMPRLESAAMAPVDSRYLFQFATPVMASVLGMTALYTADVLLVKHFFDAETAGIYGSVSTLGKMVLMATISITGAMFPHFTSLRTRGQSGLQTLAFSSGAIAVFTAGFVLVFAAAPRLVLLPFGSQFEPAAPYLPAFGLAMGIFSLLNLLVNYLLAVDDRRFVIVLAAAALGEITGIWVFHARLWQVIWCLLAVGVIATAAVLPLCLSRVPKGLKATPRERL
jgi:O-antigen/teichoic acid export membrane protein